MKKRPRVELWLLIAAIVLFSLGGIVMVTEHIRMKRVNVNPEMIRAVVLSLPEIESIPGDQVAYVATNDNGLLSATASHTGSYSVQPGQLGAKEGVWKVTTRSELAERIAKQHYFLQFDSC